MNSNSNNAAWNFDFNDAEEQREFALIPKDSWPRSS
jgi:hypothetical protein